MLKLNTSSNYNFFESNKVKIFPGSYRGNYTHGEKEEAISYVFDPESRLNTEYNYTHLPGINRHASYIVSYNDCTNSDSYKKTLICVLGGYYFEINLDEDDLSYLTNIVSEENKIYFYIKTREITLRSTDNMEPDDTRKTLVLSSFESSSESLDIYVDNEGSNGTTARYAFTGLAVTGTSLADTIDTSAVLIPFEKINKTLCINKKELIPILYHGDADSTAMLDFNSTATGNYSFAEGKQTHATNIAAHAEGSQTTASGRYSHAEGYQTIASEINSHAEGLKTKAGGTNSHAEGDNTNAYGEASHAEGGYTTTGSASDVSRGRYAHAEGEETVAYGQASHSEGIRTEALGSYSHAGGENTIVTGQSSFAHGKQLEVNGLYSMASGTTNIITEGANASATFGAHLIVNSSSQVAVGKLNNPVAGEFVVGTGHNDTNRKNSLVINDNQINLYGDISIKPLESASNAEILSIKRTDKTQGINDTSHYINTNLVTSELDVDASHRVNLHTDTLRVDIPNKVTISSRLKRGGGDFSTGNYTHEMREANVVIPNTNGYFAIRRSPETSPVYSNEYKEDSRYSPIIEIDEKTKTIFINDGKILNRASTFNYTNFRDVEVSLGKIDNTDLNKIKLHTPYLEINKVGKVTDTGIHNCMVTIGNLTSPTDDKLDIKFNTLNKDSGAEISSKTFSFKQNGDFNLPNDLLIKGKIVNSNAS
jgi:hypothetical protein